MTSGELTSKLLTNVLDIRFVRRRPIKGKPLTRRILCTKSGELLNSLNGRMSLNYRPPANAPDYNPQQKGLVTVWDIFMQDYRNISPEGATILQEIPADESFWKYFNEKLRPMSAADKMSFMQS